jgi:hypothetical protein
MTINSKKIDSTREAGFVFWIYLVSIYIMMMANYGIDVTFPLEEYKKFLSIFLFLINILGTHHHPCVPEFFPCNKPISYS